jgi:hypothetical protein
VLILIFLLLLLGLVALLWAGTLVIQGYFYTEPASELYWRAPAAAAALTLFLALWCLLASTDPGAYDAVFSFSSRQDSEFEQFWARKILPTGRWSKEEIRFHKVVVGTQTGQRSATEFQDDRGRPWAPADAEGICGAVFIKLGGERVEFRPELDEKGKFRRTEGDDSIRYTEVEGSRFFDSNAVGTVSVYRTGLFFANLLLNLLFLGVWFACLWLLLRFQWPHALGLGLVMWLAFSLPGSLVSTLLSMSTDAARQRPAAAAHNLL